MNLYSQKRLSSIDIVQDLPKKQDGDERNVFETDYDRVIFSAPIRRLADKTQVFPQEINDSVRNRLTHSHEVSNLCRSIVLQIERKEKNSPFGTSGDLNVVIPIVTAVGLAHDVGNPPFGHMGEKAIGYWVNKKIAKNKDYEVKWNGLSAAQKNDFLEWEGNAQAFRLLSKLQLSRGEFGLDLTSATMASLMKYTVASDKTEKKSQQGHPSKKKFGYFQGDADMAIKVLNDVGLKPGLRHPLAYIMEACDDIAYSVIDIEDGIQKSLISLNDVVVMLQQSGDKKSSDLANEVQKRIDDMVNEERNSAEIQEIASQYFRSFAISKLVVAVSEAYIKNKKEVLNGTFESSLMDASATNVMCKNLTDFAFKNIYKSKGIVELEVRGANLIHGLMSIYWQAIEACTKTEEDASDASFFEKYVFECISPNYRAQMLNAIDADDKKSAANKFYHQLLLLTDMVSGMTEDFAERTLEHFESLAPSPL